MKLSEKFIKNAEDYIAGCKFVLPIAFLEGLTIIGLYFFLGYESIHVINAVMVSLICAIFYALVSFVLMAILRFGLYPVYVVEYERGYNPVVVNRRRFDSRDEAQASIDAWNKNVDAYASYTIEWE